MSSSWPVMARISSAAGRQPHGFNVMQVCRIVRIVSFFVGSRSRIPRDRGRRSSASRSLGASWRDGRAARRRRRGRRRRLSTAGRGSRKNVVAATPLPWRRSRAAATRCISAGSRRQGMPANLLVLPTEGQQIPVEDVGRLAEPILLTHAQPPHYHNGVADRGVPVYRRSKRRRRWPPAARGPSSASVGQGPARPQGSPSAGRSRDDRRCHSRGGPCRRTRGSSDRESACPPSRSLSRTLAAAIAAEPGARRRQ